MLLIKSDRLLGLPEGKFSYLLQDWDQALAVENPYAQVDAVLGRILGLKQSVASLETMTRTMAGAGAGYEATRPAPPPATGAQLVVLSADGKGVPLRKPADAPAIAAHAHARGPKPDRKKMAVLGAAYPIDPHVRTPLAVVEALFRDPAAPTPGRMDRTLPRRPVPQAKRVCAVLPVAAAVAEALAPPRPVQVIFPWLQAEARRRDPDHQHPWVLLMDGQTSLWEAAAATLGDAPRVEILDLLHATGYLWEAVHLFHAPGSDLALKWMKVLTLGLLSGMGTGVVCWLQHLAEQSELPAATRTRLAQIHDYFDRHRDRIHYDRYLAAGYPIASGVIEGACRHVVKDRMERAGMHGPCPAPKPCCTSAAWRSTTSGSRSSTITSKAKRRASMRTSRSNPHPLGFASSPKPGARSTGYALFLFYQYLIHVYRNQRNFHSCLLGRKYSQQRNQATPRQPWVRSRGCGAGSIDGCWLSLFLFRVVS